MLRVAGWARTRRLYERPIERLHAEASRQYPRPPELLDLGRAVRDWARAQAHTWESLVGANAIPTIALVVRQLLVWPEEVVEDYYEVEDLLVDLCGGGPEEHPGVLRELIRVANDPDVERDLMDEYHDLFDVVDPVEDSSDSSNPRDHGALYPGSSDGDDESSEPADSSNDPDPPARFRAQGHRVGGDGRVWADHQAFVARTEYATLIEFLRERANGARLLDEFRATLRRRHLQGEHPFPPLPEGVVVERFHPRNVGCMARRRGGNGDGV